MATIVKRGKSYRFRAYAGYDISGRQIEYTMTWQPPEGLTEKQEQKEAEHQAALFEERVRNGQITDGNIRFSDFADLWINVYAKNNLKPRTVARYAELLVRANAALGHMRLEKIKPMHLMNFYDALRSSVPKDMRYNAKMDIKGQIRQLGLTQIAFSEQSGVSLTTLGTVFNHKTIKAASAQKISAGLNLPLDTVFQATEPEKTISGSTVRHYHHLLSSILGMAVKWQYIPFNPCGRVPVPKAEKTEISYLDDVQARHLVELLQHAPGQYRQAILLLLFTGLRRGELIGLEWQDIDWENKSLSVDRTSQYLPRRGVYTDTTKNTSSQRTVYLSDTAIAVLMEQKEWQRQQKQCCKEKWQGSNRVITTAAGKDMRPDALNQWFGKFVKQSDGLPPELHLHSLRHTYATLCIARHVPLTAVAAQLGHANVATTAKIYAHAIKSAQVSAADEVGSVFKDIL